jgi:ferritin
MEEDYISLIDESIKLELNVADLYLLFFNSFPEDADFWWKLVLEERNHAALIRSGKEYFEPLNKFPYDLLANSLQKVKDTNSKLKSLIKELESVSPSRQEAFNIAFDLENSAGELHFQNFMNKEKSLKIDNIFKQLNQDDKDHALRISLYMKNHDIPLQTEKG